jgi:hypothetical protein
MNFRTTATRTRSVLVLTGAGLALAAGPATAEAPKYFTTHSSGTCDTAGEWIVDWKINNGSGAVANLTGVVAQPTTSPITGIPATVEGGASVHAGQRISGSGGQTASLTYTATWADGTSTLDTWYFRPATLCTKVLPATYSGPVVDAAGVTRGSIRGEADFINVCDMLADDVAVTVEARLSDGSGLKRIAPLGGCTPAFTGGLKVTAVRGFANDYANPWHEIA